MMLVPHACVNAAAGRLIKRPLAAFTIGVAAHALLDMTPHKDISAHKAEGLAVLLILGLVGSSCGWSSPSFWCAMGGVLPDVEQVLPWTDPKRGRHRWFPTHNPRFHSFAANRWRAPLLLQSAASLAALGAAVARCQKTSVSSC
ncbi:MAG: hypothetical protein M1309_01855 [Actinobacteria bacterium]|nr:hypothetical protein [Actinomycetota bacterium]